MEESTASRSWWVWSPKTPSHSSTQARVPRVALDTRHYRGSTLEEVAREMRHDEVLEVLREAKR